MRAQSGAGPDTGGRPLCRSFLGASLFQRQQRGSTEGNQCTEGTGNKDAQSMGDLAGDGYRRLRAGSS